MREFSKKDINEIKKCLLEGKVIAFPTDTVFGLGCVYDDKDAIDKIYIAKNRDYSKTLPMMCNGLKMINEVAYINEKSSKVIESFMPGAITIIFNKKESIPDYVTGGKSTIAIRVPDDDFIIKLISELGKPMLVTSANVSGEPSLFKWEEVKEKIGNKIDGLVCENAFSDMASTIVDCTKEDIKILREGPISKETILESLL